MSLKLPHGTDRILQKRGVQRTSARYLPIWNTELLVPFFYLQICWVAYCCPLKAYLTQALAHRSRAKYLHGRPGLKAICVWLAKGGTTLALTLAICTLNAVAFEGLVGNQPQARPHCADRASRARTKGKNICEVLSEGQLHAGREFSCSSRYGWGAQTLFCLILTLRSFQSGRENKT